MSDLYTQESRLYRRQQDLGQSRIVAPPALLPLCVFLISVIITITAFLMLNDYTRRETVSGILSYRFPTLRVISESGGKLGSLEVVAGQQVRKGDLLASVYRDQPGQLAFGQDALADFTDQLEKLQEARRSQQSATDIRLRSMEGKLTATQQAIEEKRAIAEIQRQKEQANAKLAQSIGLLADKGFISELDRQRLAESWLTIRQELLQLEAAIAADEALCEELRLSIVALEAQAHSDLASLDARISQVEQSRNTMIRQSFERIFAPADGTIITINRTPGATIAGRESLLTLRPADNALQASLFIPPRAAGFLAPGQSVRLLYDAYPHQQFGSATGQLQKISGHPLTSIENPLIPAGIPPVFLAQAALERPTLSAYGEEHALREGMTLRADIVLDSRSLFDWLLEPLYALRGRI
ncbi:MAG: HlyD family efflux transporter periplasmic adaptor subunit [Pseudomonadales bacterium]|nr:HlyD family efflux transporter periplasmic adaptor subunit [Pseudomonadales bacterium]